MLKSNNLDVRSLSIDVLDSVKDALNGDALEDKAHALELAFSEIEGFIMRLCAELDKEYPTSRSIQQPS